MTKKQKRLRLCDWVLGAVLIALIASVGFQVHTEYILPSHEERKKRIISSIRDKAETKLRSQYSYTYYGSGSLSDRLDEFDENKRREREAERHIQNRLQTLNTEFLYKQYLEVPKDVTKRCKKYSKEVERMRVNSIKYIISAERSSEALHQQYLNDPYSDCIVDYVLMQRRW